MCDHFTMPADEAMEAQVEETTVEETTDEESADETTETAE